MNKYEMWLSTQERVNGPTGRLTVYLESSDVQIGDAVWDTHHRAWTTVIDIMEHHRGVHYDWANGNGAGWEYMRNNHRPADWE